MAAAAEPALDRRARRALRVLEVRRSADACAATRGSFALKGSNWFAVAEPLSEPEWKQFVALLESEHRLLRAELAAFPAERLDDFPEGGKVSFANLLYGMALHDVYHAGQIRAPQATPGDDGMIVGSERALHPANSSLALRGRPGVPRAIGFDADDRQRSSVVRLRVPRDGSVTPANRVAAADRGGIGGITDADPVISE